MIKAKNEISRYFMDAAKALAEGRLEGEYVMYHDNGRKATEAVFNEGSGRVCKCIGTKRVNSFAQ